MWNLFFFFIMVVTNFFFWPNKRKLHSSIYRRKSQSCWTSGKNNLVFGGKSIARSFFILLVKTGSGFLACCGGKCITSARATYTCHLVSAWLSLQMYSSKQEESLKKSHETYKVNEMAYDLFFVQYFMTYKKKPKRWGFPFDFPFKRQIF